MHIYENLSLPIGDDAAEPADEKAMPLGNPLTCHLDATCYNAAIQEQSIGIHYNEGRSVLDYALNPEDFKFVNGFVSLPQKPGLGVEVN